jgi:hypothetical protein
MVNISFKDISFFFYFVHRLIFWMKRDLSESGCASVFRQKKAPNLVEPLDRAIFGYRTQWPKLALSSCSTGLGAFLGLVTEAERDSETSCFIKK